MSLRRTSTCCGSQPSSFTALPLSSSTARKSCSKKGLTSPPPVAQASHSSCPTCCMPLARLIDSSRGGLGAGCAEEAVLPASPPPLLLLLSVTAVAAEEPSEAAARGMHAPARAALRAAAARRQGTCEGSQGTVMCERRRRWQQRRRRRQPRPL